MYVRVTAQTSLFVIHFIIYWGNINGIKNNEQLHFNKGPI